MAVQQAPRVANESAALIAKRMQPVRDAVRTARAARHPDSERIFHAC
jgi:hypothetical protein